MKDFEGTLVAARGITKHYGGITALDDVSLEVLPAEIHALVGENGAGKSTLVKIMTGAETPDAGGVLISGEEIGALTPEKARQHGVGAVYQEPSLVPTLTVLENMFLGRELRRKVGLLERSEMKREARDRVFAVIEELRASGLGILYISHRLAEIFRLADRATVLKDGRVVASRDVPGLTTDELIRLMVGRDIGARPSRKPPQERIVLEARELELRPDASPVSFELRAGEVLGIAGLVGSGRSRLAGALGGIHPARSGSVLRTGRPVKLRSPRDAVRAGIVVIPEDRKREGLVLAHSVRENVGLASLRELSTAGVVRRADERRLANEAAQRFGVRPPRIDIPARTLSGGNQQKVVLSKWLVRKPRPEVAVLDEPTRGVDVGAKFEIYRLIDELVDGGAGVILISSELPEVIAMSDRIIVMSEGRIAGTLEPPEFSEERILRLAVLGAHKATNGGEGSAAA